MRIYELVPDVEVLLALSIEELGMVILKSISKQAEARQPIHLQYITGDITNAPPSQAYPKEWQGEAEVAATEAWRWLEVQCILIPDSGVNGSNGFVRLSRKGKKIIEANNFESYISGTAFPKKLLHPVIADQVWNELARGDWNSAVFKAFKQVEISVREAGHYADSDVGTNLMRMAFNPDQGPLTNQSFPKAEREALCNLFVGAIGSYKNPQSHRHVSLDNALEAQEMVMLASHLLRIIDSRI